MVIWSVVLVWCCLNRVVLGLLSIPKNLVTCSGYPSLFCHVSLQTMGDWFWHTIGQNVTLTEILLVFFYESFASSDTQRNSASQNYSYNNYINVFVVKSFTCQTLFLHIFLKPQEDNHKEQMGVRVKQCSFHCIWRILSFWSYYIT